MGSGSPHKGTLYVHDWCISFEHDGWHLIYVLLASLGRASHSRGAACVSSSRESHGGSIRYVRLKTRIRLGSVSPHQGALYFHD